MLNITEEKIRTHISEHIEGKSPPDGVILKFRLNKSSSDFDLLNKKSLSLFLKNTVVFISDRPNYFFLRMSSSLVDMGFNTILLTRWGVDKEHGSFFSSVLLFNSMLDLYILAELRQCFIYVQSWVGWFFLPVFVDFITKVPVFCNVNDSSIMLFDYMHSFRYIDLNRANASFDIECEKYIYKNFKLVTHPYKNTELLKYINDNHVVYFPCYPLNNFIKRREVQKKYKKGLLFIGAIPFDSKPDIVFKDAKIHSIAKSLLRQNLCLTILNNPLISNSKNNMKNNYPFFSILAKRNKNFEFKSGYHPWNLFEHTYNFEYGIMVYDFSDILISKRHIETIVPTKFFTYIELGIPIIVIDKMKAVSKIVTKYNLGFVICQNQIDFLDSIIESNSFKYESYLKSVFLYANNHSMNNKISSILSHFRLH